MSSSVGDDFLEAGIAEILDMAKNSLLAQVWKEGSGDCDVRITSCATWSLAAVVTLQKFGIPFSCQCCKVWTTALSCTHKLNIYINYLATFIRC